MQRRKTASVTLGRGGSAVTIGGNAPIRIQSMLSTDSHDAEACYKQTKALADAGCEIVRLAIPDVEAAKTIAYLKERGITVPLVADIHFDYRIALEAAACGVDKIRINPGNIGDDDRVHAVVRACREHGIPIRIGVNSGSLEKHILAKHGAPTADALAESALYHASLLEKFEFHDIVLSVKASTVKAMIDANRSLAAQCAYPLHLGVTEAGSVRMGTVKSDIGIGALLADGIGDTIRVSLTADPTEEVYAAKRILSALELCGGYDVVSCPTCGRTQIPLVDMVAAFERRMNELPTLPEGKMMRVAIMGCAVNGPGEAREADVGLAGGKNEAVLIRRGEILKKVPQDVAITALIDLIKEEVQTL